MKTLALIHTTPVTVTSMKALTNQLAPGVRVINVLDDSLLPDVMQAGHPTPQVTERLRSYAGAAVQAGADAVMCCCSSVGESVETLRAELGVPFLRIDEPMAQDAVRRGERIGVIATVGSTLEPTARLIERAAAHAARAVHLERRLVDGAYDALLQGHGEQHDRLVTEALRDLAERSDVVVLAQASMARLIPGLGNIRTPILSSPESGLARALEVLS
ncbi:aspartate/glutamate racemase family protein [Deinococcus peraridilitoris]|uniref:Aspartate racemase n=1 Tax=Deinococcus peraridilitoris (strain DSM 19664 / LMG 22246 / CIP 109416 / KR-200) TaxID=937777 RepID=K9ZXM7_DEIPD|nr:aspartate/glutamate racemase family protein [Deinococcus peraridilitoris]AFZ65647.1 aspartate racemase [Deinococcus peraridilitoris DSM 19664]